MDQLKLNSILDSMKKNNVPQLIVADPASICYLTGRMLNCGERMLALYLDIEGNHKLFIGKLFPQATPIEGAEIVYFDDIDDYIGMLADVMREGTVVGIDKVWPAKFLLPLMKKLNAREFIDGSFIIDNIRQIKNEKEISYEEGIRKGEDLLSILIQHLLATGRMDDVKRVTTDAQYRRELYKEFGL